jgi:tetratricopeptide (TPR) repeat protein
MTFQSNTFLKKSLTLCFTIFFCTASFSQKATKEEKKLLKHARKYLMNEKYKSAQESYAKLVTINPNDNVYNFEAGLSYYYDNVNRAKSISLFETALKNSKDDTIPELQYYLGRAYHANGQFEKSKETLKGFTPFIKNNTKAGQSLLKETNYRIQLNDNGIKYSQSINTKIKVENLGTSINTSGREYAPVFRKQDNIILFTSRRKGNEGKDAFDLLPYEDVFAAKKTASNSWSLIEDKEELSKYLPKGFNTKKHDAGVIYSSDGKTLYTYKEDILWKSIFKDNKWSKLEELDKNINNTQYNVPSLSITRDGKTLFFSTERKNGFGGKDIYKSIKDDNGNWSEPENLGPEINTKFDEDAPFLSADGMTLYFSSKGHDGVGGYDIFKSKFIDGKLTAPVNMGLPLNSPLDDIYIIIDDNSTDEGFFSSNREGGNGDMDIYSFSLKSPSKIINTINGLIVDNKDSSLDGAVIAFRAVNSDSQEETYQSKGGKFTITSESTGRHSFSVDAPNYEKQTIGFELPNETSDSDIKIKLTQFKDGNDLFQVINLTSKKLGLNKADTIKVEPLIVTNNTSSTNNNSDNNTTNTSSKTLGSYQELFDYNNNGVNTSSSQYSAMINNAMVIKAKTGGKIYIDIESSASRVPTKTFKSNINLASLRGDKAKQTIIETLIKYGVSKDKIVINKINSIVSGPKYIGDYKNSEKYKKFQYVKITIK